MTEASKGRLLLGSGSPRRREILENLRVPFVVHVASADESTHPGEQAAAYLERVVLLKLAAVSGVFGAPGSRGAPLPLEHPTASGWLDASAAARAAASSSDVLGDVTAVLVADTSVIDGGDILGKPASSDENEAMIARLAGRTHEVWTRFVIGTPDATPTVRHAETVITRVTFRALSSHAIRAYATSGEGSDKAGGYAVQGLGSGIVSRIDGSYTNVVGLPACEVRVALEGLGLAR